MVPLEELRKLSGVVTIGWESKDLREERILLWEVVVAVMRRVPSRRKRALGWVVRNAASTDSLSRSGHNELRGVADDERSLKKTGVEGSVGYPGGGAENSKDGEE